MTRHPGLPRPLRLALALLVLLALGGCALTPRLANLEARVVADAPLELPRNAELSVTLREGSASGGVIATGNYTRLGRGPIPVILRYDANAVGAGGDYRLRAEIRADGRLLYASPEPVAVLTGNAATGPVEVPVEPVAASRP
ncbi:MULTISPECIES: YbaY family lipoprotein [Halomonadaceae]|uniref:Lipoprotein n=1 Tax=Modicisalibacter zincidurans TaxID=1178777 RepID=A0ABP9R6E7_9GAMM|nr:MULTISPECIES: YbaY family lipoprotein [Halomonas]MCD6007866.1 YbaY family lipoprotein [Halomonas sp. IOP_31]